MRLGIAEQEDLLKSFEEVSTKMGEPDANLEELLDEQSKLQVRAIEYLVVVFTKEGHLV